MLWPSKGNGAGSRAKLVNWPADRGFWPDIAGKGGGGKELVDSLTEHTRDTGSCYKEVVI